MQTRAGWLPRRTWTVVLVAMLSTGLVALSRAFSVSCAVDAPCVTLGELRRGAELPQANRIYDREGTLLAEVSGPLRRALAPNEIPGLVREAFVVVEDRRFWEHDGVDARGVVRAALRNLQQGGIAEGASTIPMQLVRTLWAESLRDVGPWRRKIIEARTAPRLVDQLGHERVLTLYLNAIYLGNGIYGVERAARYYFGVGVAEATLGQVATLVGMTRSPETFEPRRYPERARRVRDLVLAVLVEEHVVSTEEARGAADEPVETVPLSEAGIDRVGRSHLTEAVRREMERVAPELAGRSGLEIRTTVDARVQQVAQETLAARLGAIESGRSGQAPAVGPGPAVDADADPALEGAAVALESGSGAVRAWVGGRDFSRSEFDRVDRARRQVGSLVKPFLVALALERGYGVVDPVSADTVPIPVAGGETWLPADHVEETTLPMREALIRSSNRAAAHLGTSLGLAEVAAVVRRVGLEGPVPTVPSATIGAFDASLLEMTRAYAAFGNGGLLVDPYIIEEIGEAQGEVLWARTDSAEETRVLDEATAFVVLDALRGVVDRGTARSVRDFGYRGPAAGKTGTTNEGRDAWFVGLTPELTAGVWVGFDEPRPIVQGQGGGALAAPTWALWMQGLSSGGGGRSPWMPPLSVERVRYDRFTGDVVGPHCRLVGRHDFVDAWVSSGRYDRTVCPRSGLERWLDRVWRVFGGGEPEPRPIGAREPGNR